MASRDRSPAPDSHFVCRGIESRRTGAMRHWIRPPPDGGRGVPNRASRGVTKRRDRHGRRIPRPCPCFGPFCTRSRVDREGFAAILHALRQRFGLDGACPRVQALRSQRPDDRDRPFEATLLNGAAHSADDRVSEELVDKTMFAVIKTGGKQYKVAAGDQIEVEKLDGEAGASLTFDSVLMVSGDDGLKVGAPLIEGASVVGEIVGQKRTRKIIIFKKRRRKSSRRRNGHRQPLTVVRITDISLGAAA